MIAFLFDSQRFLLPCWISVRGSIEEVSKVPTGSERQHILHVSGRQVSVAHRHAQRRMPKNLLKRKDAATVGHEVRGEGVSQYVGFLSGR